MGSSDQPIISGAPSLVDPLCTARVPLAGAQICCDSVSSASLPPSICDAGGSVSPRHAKLHDIVDEDSNRTLYRFHKDGHTETHTYNGNAAKASAVNSLTVEAFCGIREHFPKTWRDYNETFCVLPDSEQKLVKICVEGLLEWQDHLRDQGREVNDIVMQPLHQGIGLLCVDDKRQKWLVFIDFPDGVNLYVDLVRGTNTKDMYLSPYFQSKYPSYKDLVAVMKEQKGIPLDKSGLIPVKVDKTCTVGDILAEFNPTPKFDFIHSGTEVKGLMCHDCQTVVAKIIQLLRPDLIPVLEGDIHEAALDTWLNPHSKLRGLFYEKPLKRQ